MFFASYAFDSCSFIFPNPKKNIKKWLFGKHTGYPIQDTKTIIVWHTHTFSKIQIASSRNCKTAHQKSSPWPTKKRFVPKTRHPYDTPRCARCQRCPRSLRLRLQRVMTHSVKPSESYEGVGVSGAAVSWAWAANKLWSEMWYLRIEMDIQWYTLLNTCNSRYR